MSVINSIAQRKHEQVSVFNDSDTGLLAIIAVHDTSVGPGLGGCRVRPYKNLEEALFDVLFLSEGMTYKNALCGINFGGGKAVIVGDYHLREGREQLFQSFGRCVQSLGGKYITAEDMGTSEEDMSSIGKSTQYVTGRSIKEGGAGDPSPFTATGIFHGMRACLERVFGTDSFSGRHVALQGVGSVGHYLCELLANAGARLTLSDTRPERLDSFAKNLGAKIVATDDIYNIECDIFSPCAVGQIINPITVEKLKCKIIAGGANNQIYGDQVEERIMARGILYAPDFAINAGGVIAVSDEREEGGFQKARVDNRVAQIYNTLGKIIDASKGNGEFTGKVALNLAINRIKNARLNRTAV